jgi:copper chaperone CopZ
MAAGSAILLMRHTLAFLIVVCFFICRASFAQTAPKPVMKIDTIAVHDLRCGQCETRIHRALKKVDGISKDNSYADVETQTVVVEYNPQLVSRKTIEELIVKTGYGVGSTPGDAEARKALPGCCK